MSNSEERPRMNLDDQAHSKVEELGNLLKKQLADREPVKDKDSDTYRANERLISPSESKVDAQKAPSTEAQKLKEIQELKRSHSRL